ncbi:MAG: response regulator [Bdellovibrionota bacterium]|nr:response regulator [Bdellovibrionota bacterium]
MEKIIIIDDSVTLRMQLKTKLESAGYEVVEADDGLVGLEVIQSNQDAFVIITDINMPSMDGLTMLEVVQEKGLATNIGKIILTTETSGKMKERGKATGVSAWFAKPISEKRMVVLINLLEKLKSENP